MMVLHGCARTVLLSASLLASGTIAHAAEPAALAPSASARCLAHRLPMTTQTFRARDGRETVVMFGHRGNVARWAVGGGPASSAVVRSGGGAGLDRLVGSACP